METVPRLVHICCDVAARAPLGTPCWVCGEVGPTLNLEEESRFHPWKRPWKSDTQTAANWYL